MTGEPCAVNEKGMLVIEEGISSYPNVAEVAVAFVLPKQSDSLDERDVAHSEKEAMMALVGNQIGNFGRPI